MASQKQCELHLSLCDEGNYLVVYVKTTLVVYVRTRSVRMCVCVERNSFQFHSMYVSDSDTRIHAWHRIQEHIILHAICEMLQRKRGDEFYFVLLRLLLYESKSQVHTEHTGNAFALLLLLFLPTKIAVSFSIVAFNLLTVDIFHCHNVVALKL